MQRGPWKSAGDACFLAGTIWRGSGQREQIVAAKELIQAVPDTVAADIPGPDRQTASGRNIWLG